MEYICQYCEEKIPDERVKRATRLNKEPRFCSDRCQKGWSHHHTTEAVFLATLGLRKIGKGVYEKKCKYCGSTFSTSNPQQRHCSTTCNKLMDKHGCTKAEWDARHKDTECVDDDAQCRKAESENEVVKEVERLREKRTPEYYRAVFRLPDDKQTAEIETWTGEDHSAALEAIGFSEGGLDEDDDEEVSIDTTSSEDMKPFDEENEFLT